MRSTILAGVLAFALLQPLSAQLDTGNITGRVTDPTGAAVLGAKVIVTQTETNIVTEATTNDQGIYRALNLRPGPYKVEATASGFKKFIRENLDLSSNATLGIDLPLQIGSLTDSVSVTTQAPLLETEVTQAGTQVQGEFFYSLPNYQRHVVADLLFTPGVSFGSNASVKSMPNLAGLTSSSIGYFEDGTLATFEGRNSDNVETVDNAVEDIKVFTAAMPAEYGHTAGVGISVVKKSGGNAIHGMASEQLRTRSMQQRRYFELYRNSQIQPGFSINPPGLIVQNPDANFSGPVYIPKIYNGKNKTFFFYGFQMMIEKQGKQLSATVPTAGMLNGDFSCGPTGAMVNGVCPSGGFAGSNVAPNPIYDPSTSYQDSTGWHRNPFPGNIIPQNQWSNVAKKFLALNIFAAPNVPGTWTATGPTNNVQMGPMKMTLYQNHSVRLDHQVSTNVKAYASYTYNHEWGRQPDVAVTNPLYDSSLDIGYTDRHTGSLGTTWVVNPTTVNDFRVLYNQRYAHTASAAQNTNLATTIGLGAMGLPKTCEPQGIISLGNNFSDQASLQHGCGSSQVQETYTLKDDLSKAKGSHNFKAGVEFLRYHNNQNAGPGNVDGNFTYSGNTNITTTGSNVSNTGGFGLASFMLGNISSFYFDYNMHQTLTRSYEVSGYIQDDWKVRPNLTLSYGLRYNVEPPKHDKYGYLSLFDLTLPDNSIHTNTAYQSFCPAGGCTGAYKHPVGAAAFPTDWGRLDPTLGISWHFADKMVLRGGGRISHTDTYTDGQSLLYTSEMLNRSSGTISQPSGVYKPLFQLDQGLPTWSYPAIRSDGSTIYSETNVGGLSPTLVDFNNFKTPYVLTDYLGIERELSKDYLVEVRYSGTVRAKGYGTYNLNARPWGMIPNANHDGGTMNLGDPANAAYRYKWSTGGDTAYQTNYARPYPNLGDINVTCNCAHMDRQSGMVRLEKRYSKGLNFQVYYEYSKALGGGSGNIYASTWYLQKAPTGQDQRHNMTGSLNYEVPVGKGRHFLGHTNRLVDAVLGGYNVIWSYTIASGMHQGLSISGVSLPSTNFGGTSSSAVSVPQYPGWMPTYGNVVYSKVPKLRDNWQDLGGDRFTQQNQNSMIGNCGVAVVNTGDDCFTYKQAYSNGNDSGNLFTNQRIIAASAAISKEVPLKGERFRLALRLDLQNPFKWYNWGGTNTALNVTNASTVGATNTFGTINPNSNGETSTGTQGFGGTPLLNLTVALKW
jgi:hypothetical protein